MNRNLLIIGEDAYAGLKSSLIRGFEKLDWKVKSISLYKVMPPNFERMAFRFSYLAEIFRTRFEKIIVSVPQLSDIDLVVVVKGAFMSKYLIRLLKEKTGAIIVCWNPDSPFDFAISNRGSSLKSMIKYYDYYVTWAEDVCEQIKASNNRCFVIPFAWDNFIHFPVTGTGIASGRIVFIGTGSRQRVHLISRLAFLRPIVFGDSWPQINGVELRSPIYGDIMSSVVNEAKWNLNLLRPQNIFSHNMRTFELPGAGGNQVVKSTRDHREFLRSDSRTLLYDSFDELVDILKSDPNLLEARNRSFLNGNSYVDRVQMLLNVIYG